VISRDLEFGIYPLSAAATPFCLAVGPPDDYEQIGAERFFWAFVVAVVLFSLSSLSALVEAAMKLRTPDSVGSIWVARSRC
jgi:hypothetical protein